jgi:hypothetical protein
LKYFISTTVYGFSWTTLGVHAVGPGSESDRIKKAFPVIVDTVSVLPEERAETMKRLKKVDAVRAP